MPKGRRFRQKKSKLAPVSRYETQEEWDSGFKLLVTSLAAHFGRMPTDDEIDRFLNGTTREQLEIWKAGENSGEDAAAEERSEEERQPEEAEHHSESSSQGEEV